MTFRAADYSVNFNMIGAPVVIIDLHDGFTETFTEQGLQEAIATVRRHYVIKGQRSKS